MWSECIYLILSPQVVLYVERVYGSLDSIQIRYRTVSDTATGHLDYRQIDNGAVTMDPKQTRSSIFIEVSLFIIIIILCHNTQTYIHTRWRGGGAVRLWEGTGILCI